MSRITSNWKPQNTFTSNNKQNPKMHERDLSKNQKLTTTSTGKGHDVECKGGDGQQMGEWNLVGHKRKTSKRSRPAPIKGELEKFNLTVAENQCCLFVSGLNPDVVAQEVKEYIDETFNIKCKCEKMKTKKDKFKSSFKIYVPVDSKDKVMNGSMWGKGIIVNHFLHLRRNIDRELN
ncbi:uncharacterized protein LOC123307619 [Coccinella septempunctata]|nr:uncharacterized protein LOC123307619 [Coccinella septempunctata]